MKTKVHPLGKNLRRLPHTFSRVLELPFRADADVSVEETSQCFRFVAEAKSVDEDVRAHTIHIHPGITKIVIRGPAFAFLGLNIDDLELDRWRFRLPDTTIPDLATALCSHGELVVTVPKTDHFMPARLMLVH